MSRMPPGLHESLALRSPLYAPRAKEGAEVTAPFGARYAVSLSILEQLLAGVDLRATTLITHIAALARDAGRTDADIDDRTQMLRAEIP